MYEAIPVGAGLVVGYFATRIDDTRTRAIVVGVLAVILGVIASTIAGEEWFFIPFDIFQAAFASVVAILVTRRYLAPARNRNRDE